MATLYYKVMRRAWLDYGQCDRPVPENGWARLAVDAEASAMTHARRARGLCSHQGDRGTR